MVEQRLPECIEPVSMGGIGCEIAEFPWVTFEIVEDLAGAGGERIRCFIRENARFPKFAGDAGNVEVLHRRDFGGG